MLPKRPAIEFHLRNGTLWVPFSVRPARAHKKKCTPGRGALIKYHDNIVCTFPKVSQTKQLFV